MNKQKILGVIKEALFLIFIVLIQNNISKLLEIHIWYPDLTIIAIFFIGHYRQPQKAMSQGFIMGLFQDILTSFLGLNSLCKTVSAFGTRYFPYQANYNYMNLTYGLIIVTFIHHFIYFNIYYYNYIGLLEIVTSYVIPNVIYTSFIGLLIYFLFESKLSEWYAERK